MSIIVQNFFLTVAGEGNEHSFFLGLLSLFVSGVVVLFLIEPIT